MVLPVACALAVSATGCFGQEIEDFPEAAMTREQWQRQTEDARRRSEEFVARLRARTAGPDSNEWEERQSTDQRAMNDPTLQRGDIVSTSRGFLVFDGCDEMHQPNDFRPLGERR